MILTLLNSPPRETTYSNEIFNTHDIENEYAPLDRDKDSVLGLVATLNECSVLGMMATMLPKTFWSSFPLLLVTIVPTQ